MLVLLHLALGSICASNARVVSFGPSRSPEEIRTLLNRSDTDSPLTVCLLQGLGAKTFDFKRLQALLSTTLTRINISGECPHSDHVPEPNIRRPIFDCSNEEEPIVNAGHMIAASLHGLDFVGCRIAIQTTQDEVLLSNMSFSNAGPSTRGEDDPPAAVLSITLGANQLFQVRMRPLC